MPGNLRRKTKGAVTEHAYEKARKQCINSSSVCAICAEIVDKNLPKGICHRVMTDEYTVHNAHEIPADCSPTCKAERHPRKAHPYGPSADHIVSVASMAPGDPRLVDPKNLQLCHTLCNVRKQQGGNKKQELVTLKNWLA